MTVPTAWPQVAAFMALFDPLPFDVHLGKAPDGAAPPYAAVYPDPGAIEAISLAAPDEGLVVYAWIHAVGEGPEQALVTMGLIANAIVGQQPSVTGRSLWRIWQEPSPPPLTRDDDVTSPLYLARAEFGIRSEPA